MKRKKKYIFLGVFHGEKPKIDILKDLTKYRYKTHLCFPTPIFPLGTIHCKVD
jgi:hypothetical protein